MEGWTSSAGQVFLLGTLAVQGNAAATAHNILAHETQYRLGFLVSVASVAFHLGWALFMYQLLRPVHRTVAALAGVIVLTCCAIQAVTALLYAAPLVVLESGQAAGGLETPQVQGLAYALLQLNGTAYDLDLILFGLWCILTGYLVWSSTFLPRILGLLLLIDGVGWTLFAWPPLATFLFPAIAVAAGLAELPTQLWLLVMGVNTSGGTSARQGRGSATQSCCGWGRSPSDTTPRHRRSDAYTGPRCPCGSASSGWAASAS
jgi:hypothetical protein